MPTESTRAFVRFRTSTGDVHELGHGDILGRLWSAAMFLDNPRVSEAHAMVSLRDRSLRLIALRGRFAVDGAVLSDVELMPGLQVDIARDLSLTVEFIQLPAQVLAIEGDGLPRHILTGVSSLRLSPRPELLPGDIKGADACIWGSGIGWRLRTDPAQPPRPLMAGDSFELHGKRFRAVAVALDKAGKPATQLTGGLQSPLDISAQYDSVHIYREDVPPLVLNGISARIVSELVVFDGPVGWEVLAKEIWSDSDPRSQLRRKLDVSLARLRKRLRDARIRPDLVRANGDGMLELFLHPRDHTSDNT